MDSALPRESFPSQKADRSFQKNQRALSWKRGIGIRVETMHKATTKHSMHKATMKPTRTGESPECPHTETGAVSEEIRSHSRPCPWASWCVYPSRGRWRHGQDALASKQSCVDQLRRVEENDAMRSRGHLCSISRTLSKLSFFLLRFVLIVKKGEHCSVPSSPAGGRSHTKPSSRASR